MIKLGYDEIETDKLIHSMNKLLASYSVHYQKLRNFHWNVKGADFFDIHEQFELQYDEAKIAIDDIAERIRVFGSRPLSSMAEYIENSDIDEPKGEMNSIQMVESVLDDYAVLIEQMFDVLDLAIEAGDSGTEDLMKGFIKTLEKHHWMMTSFSSDD